MSEDKARFFTESDVDANALSGKRIAVIGYGSQGRGQALNLRDSGLDVVLGLRPASASTNKKSTWNQAEEDGWKPLEVAEAVRESDIIAILVPDMAQPKVYDKEIAPNLKPGSTLLFSHGLNVHFNQIKPPADVDVVMVAPKGPGKLVRRTYEEGFGVPCLIAVEQDASGEGFKRALAYAQGVGGTRAGVLETSFAEETETDLFGEQAVLCGGVTELIAAGFETLVNAGYQPEVAYFECLHEVKLIVDLIYEGGFAKMHEFVSETAKYGDLTRGPRVVDDRIRAEMKDILTEIQDGTFAKQWVLENQAGLPQYHALLRKDLEHPVEKVGKELRARMSWIGSKD